MTDIYAEGGIMKIVIATWAAFMLGIIAGLQWKQLQTESEVLYAVKDCEQSVTWIYENTNSRIYEIERRIKAMENTINQQNRWQ